MTTTKPFVNSLADLVQIYKEFGLNDIMALKTATKIWSFLNAFRTLGYQYHDIIEIMTDDLAMIITGEADVIMDELTTNYKKRHMNCK